MEMFITKNNDHAKLGSSGFLIMNYVPYIFIRP